MIVFIWFCVSIPPDSHPLTKKGQLFSSAGEFAFKIIAYDPDNDPLTYRITKDNDIFNVSVHTGDVYIRTQLDREVGIEIILKKNIQ